MAQPPASTSTRTLYAVCDGDLEMPYGYPPSVHALLTSSDLAEQTVDRWVAATQDRGPGDRWERLGPNGSGLYVVPVTVYDTVPETPEPGLTSAVGFDEYLQRTGRASR